jgi:glycosyltransferase involved in cell wall biosynthesis
VRRRVAHLTTVDMSLALLLAPELAADVEEGFEVFALSAPGPYVAEVEALGVAHVAIPSLTRQWDVRADARAARELWRALRRLDLDVLHTHTPKAGVLGRVLGRLVGVPVVVDTCHGLWVREGDPWPKRAAVLAVEAAASQFADAELYQNADDREAMRWAVPEHRGRVVGNGVDLDLFRFDPEGRAHARAQLGVGEAAGLVGGVGRWVAEKGTAELGAAARALRRRARFVWVGPVEEVGGEAGGDLLGPRPRDQMAAFYSALDVFVLPSHREGFSRSAMEAAACGRPMVLADIRGCREVGEHGRHLLLVPPGDAAALTEAVRTLIDDAGLRARLGAAAEARAREAFDQRAVARASVETYRSVAARKGLRW